jgi:hypothetical protein
MVIRLRGTSIESKAVPRIINANASGNSAIADSLRENTKNRFVIRRESNVVRVKKAFAVKVI